MDTWTIKLGIAGEGTVNGREDGFKDTENHKRNMGNDAIPHGLSKVSVRSGSRTMTLTAVHFAAIVLAALALVPAGAHLFALPNKISMGQGQYFTAQSAYSGWAFLGLILIA